MSPYYNVNPRKNYLKNDPRWTVSRYPRTTCKDCSNIIPVGNSMFYYPKDKTCYCKICGDKRSDDFNMMREHEESVSGNLSNEY